MQTRIPARVQATRTVLVLVLAATVLLAAALLSVTVRPTPAQGGAPPTVSTDAVFVTVGSELARKKKPTVVLVHGAFADSSGWNDVSALLMKDGYTVRAWSNPLRNVTSDGAYLRTYLSTIKGPIVLVGHSYGGAVITEASTDNPNVKALVYVAAFALAEGENVATASDLGGGHSPIVDNIELTPYPGAPEGDADAIVKPSAFRKIFAQDLPRSLSRVMAASQRPAALGSLLIPAGEPGWKSIPSYYLQAKNDHLIPPQAQSVMAKRAGATTKKVASSHVLMMTHPELTARFIERAAKR